MAKAFHSLLSSRGLDLAARTLLTAPFWGNGLVRLFDFQGTLLDMSRAGLEPAALFGLVVICVQLVGSGLVILNRQAWLGAAGLATVLLLTLPHVDGLWTLDGPAAALALRSLVEHGGLIGGLILAAILGLRPRVSFVRVAFPAGHLGSDESDPLRLRGSKWPRHACP